MSSKSWENDETNPTRSSTPISSDEKKQNLASPAPEEQVGIASESDDTIYPTGLKLALIVLSICTSTLLVALDGTIIATAIPTITSEFNSLDDTSWYNASLFLTSCAFQLPFGRAYTLLSTKYTFLTAIFIFEIGSTVCGAAPNSIALIIGRAIQGIGGAGIFGGCFIILAESTPLKKRSLFNGLLGATFAVTAVVGPVIGGALTSHVSWRWCFFINLPVGAVVLLIVFLCLPKQLGSSSTKPTNITWLQLLRRFDPLATIILLAAVICLLLALSWGGVQYSWNSPQVIATLTLFGVLIIAWMALQVYRGDDATLPRRVVCQRSVAAATLYTICGSAAFSLGVFYLPIWFQAIRQDNPVHSGLHILAIVLSVTFSTVATGGAVVAVGYYTPFLILGSVLASVGAGLLYTLKSGSSTATWVGYQILFGAGCGMGLELGNIAVQTVLPKDKIQAGISLAVFARSLGGAIAVSIGQNVFEHKLREEILSVLPDLDPSIISGSGATNLIPNVQSAVGGDQVRVHQIVDLYNNAIVQVFLVAMIFSAITFLASLAIEWRSVKKEKMQEVATLGQEKDGTHVKSLF